MLMTPGGKSVCSAMSSPARRRTRGVGCRLEDDAVSGGQGGPDLGEVDLVGKVPRGDGADDADGLARDGAPGGDAHRRRLAEILVVFVGFGGVRGERQVVDRDFELGDAGEHSRRPDFGDGQVAQLFEVLLHRLAQLPDAAHPQFGVARPVRLIEGAPRGIDRAFHVGGVGVGGDTQHFLGRRIDRGKGASAAGRHLAVDEEFAHAVGQQGHVPLLSVRGQPATPI